MFLVCTSANNTSFYPVAAAITVIHKNVRLNSVRIYLTNLTYFFVHLKLNFVCASLPTTKRIDEQHKANIE